MSSILLSKEEQGIVVFHILKSLKYKTRLALCILLIVAGLALQFLTLGSYNESTFLFLGVVIVFTGNLLMLVKGYTNKIKLDTYSAESEWVSTNSERLQEIVDINKKAKKWDINGMDVSNGLGAFVLIAFIAVLIVLTTSRMLDSFSAKKMLFLNAFVLFVPHWLTGIRRVTLTPNLIKKINIYQHVMEHFGKELESHEVDFLMYVKGSDEKLPRDVKMKVDFKGQPENFLGMYAQISMNNVQETYYPYFYVVLVAKKGTMMNEQFQKSVILAPKILSEFKQEGDVEILVLRQVTTKKSGYHTKPAAIINSFNVGLQNAELLLKQVK